MHRTWDTLFIASYLGHIVQCIVLGPQCSVHHTWGTVFSESDQGTCRSEDGICPLLIVPFIESRITAVVLTTAVLTTAVQTAAVLTAAVPTAAVPKAAVLTAAVLTTAVLKPVLCLSIGVSVSWKVTSSYYVNICKQLVEDFSGVLLQQFCTNTDRNHWKTLRSK